MATKRDTPQILVVDDEPLIRDTLAEFLHQRGYDVTACDSGEAALAASRTTSFDIAICDINLPGLDGLEVQERLARLSPETCIILITAYATVDTAVEAFQNGASDYLMKPIIFSEVLEKIRRLLKQKAIAQENQWLRRELNLDTEGGPKLVGGSPAIQTALRLAKKVGPTPSPVLIVGASGTGKELLARAIHRYSQRGQANESRFQTISCAAIPSETLEHQLFGTATEDVGALRTAGPGTVFLDEVAELPLPIQAKLLRIVEQKEHQPTNTKEPIRLLVRILAASKKDLAAEVTAGRFREDLFYRLSVVTIRLPALRDRREDIPELVEHLVAKHARELGKKFAGVTHETMELLLKYPWAGNVRELDNTLQRAIILGDGPLIRPSDLPQDLAPKADDPSVVDELSVAVMRFEKLHIERMLRMTLDKREAARRLDIGLSSLYRKIEQYGIG